MKFLTLIDDDYMDGLKTIEAPSGKAAAQERLEARRGQIDDGTTIYVIEPRHAHTFTVSAPREDPKLRDDDAR